jgi:hypothetical protein
MAFRVFSSTVKSASFWRRGNHAVDDVVLLGRLLGRTGDDERRACLVDEDRVDLVDDRVVEETSDGLAFEVRRLLRVDPVHVVGERELHVVAQVVEAELVVLPVGDVGVVGGLALLVGEAVDDHPDREAEEAIEPAHPLGVAAGEVVVDGDDVDALALERVQVHGQGRDQRLALAGLHLGDAAFVEDHAAHELDVEMAHPEDAARRLTDDRERLRENVVERRALIELLAQLAGLGTQLVVGEIRQTGTELVDALDQRPHALQLPIVLGSDDPANELLQHRIVVVITQLPGRRKGTRGDSPWPWRR